jgi:ubiquitin carboxyl-terminal hydrolase MINDY-1/2
LNPRFHDCRAYEFTDEVAIFDLLQVPLLHGWLVDPQVGTMHGLTEHATPPTIRSQCSPPVAGLTPAQHLLQDEEAVKVIGGTSYNELLSRLISLLGDGAPAAAASAPPAAAGSLASPPRVPAPAAPAPPADTAAAATASSQPSQVSA